MTVVVTHSTPSDASFSATGATAWDATHTLSGVGTMAGQDANNVAITGGSINGTTVGATTASTGAFTTLGASSTVSGAGFDTYLASPPAIGGTAAAAGTFTTLISNSTAQFGKSSVNYLQAVGGATTVAPALTVQSSSDTNVDFSIKALGTGSTLIGTGNGTAIAAADSGATIAWWQFTGTATSTGNMIARVGGGGTNTSLISVAKGTGTIQFATNNTATTVQMQVSNTTSAVNYVQVTGATTASKVVAISAQGSDTDVTLSLSPKGAGTIRFGTYTGTILTPTGYITITDSGGTSRRLLVG